MAKKASFATDDFDKILDGLEKQFGEGNIYNGEDAFLKDKRILTSAPRLNFAYGGSFKLNAIHRLNGLESSGKTTLATYIAGECQRAKYKETKDWNNCHVVILDNERAFDVSHAEALGLLLTNPDNGKPLVHVCRNLYLDDQEVAFEKMVVSGKVCCTIYDSDAAGQDKASFGEVGYEELSKATFGSGAKMNGIVIKRMNYFVDRYNTPVIWISQERANQCISKNTNVTFIDLKDTTKKETIASIGTLFQEKFNLKIEDMEYLKPYLVEDRNIGILAYEEDNSHDGKVFSKIVACIKKPATPKVRIKLEDRQDWEEPVSEGHLYLILYNSDKVEKYSSYIQAGKIDLRLNPKVYTSEQKWVKITEIENLDSDEDWLDIQTETENYFANGILSHNSPMAHLNSLTGGYAVNYYPSTRFRVSCKEFITKNGEIVGIKMKVKNYKNKTGTPFRECLLDLYFKDGPDYKAGIDGEGQYLDMLIDLGLISQRGAWYYYRENDPNENKRQKFQGWNGVQQWFKDNPDEFEQVKKLVDEKMSQFNERLDKNTLELNEADEIKNEIEDAQKRKAENAEKLQQIEQTDQLGQVE